MSFGNGKWASFSRYQNIGLALVVVWFQTQCFGTLHLMDSMMMVCDDGYVTACTQSKMLWVDSCTGAVAVTQTAKSCNCDWVYPILRCLTRLTTYLPPLLAFEMTKQQPL